jgi:uncharacterized delta-60 repeat protein
MRLSLLAIVGLTLLSSTLAGQNALGDFHAPVSVRGALVNAMIEQPDGKILIGGDISRFGNTPAGNIIRVDANGNLDNTFSFEFEEEGCYAADMALAASGDLVVLMRQLNRFSTVPRDKSWVVRLHADGSVEKTIATLPYATVLALQEDGKILVGAFQPRPLARYNQDLTEDAAFNAIVTLDGGLSDIKITTNKIYLVGGFKTVNGVAKSSLVGLNLDGSIDISFDLGASKVTQIDKLTILPDGKLIFGGFAIYNFPDGTTLAPPFRLNTDGSLDDAFKPTFPHGTFVYNQGVASAEGYYTQTRTPAVSAEIIRIKYNGDIDETFNPISLDDRDEFDPCMIPSGTGLVLANAQNPVNKYNISRVTSSGDFDETFAPPLAREGSILHSDYVDGKILVGGDFISIDGHDTNCVARLNQDGTVDGTFSVSEHHGTVAQVKLLADKSVLIKAEQRLLKLDPQGNNATGFHWESGAGNLYYIEKFKVLANGMIMAVDGNTLARLYADGSVDESFSINRMGDMGSTAVDFDMQGDNIIYGTLFEGVQGLPAHNLARLTPAGTADPTFNAGGGPQAVRDGAFQTDWPGVSIVKGLDNGEILVGGMFNRFDGKEAYHSLAKLSRDGAFNETFNANLASEKLWGISLPKGQIEQVGATLYIVATPLLYALNTDGTVNADFAPPVTVDLATSITIVPNADEPSGISLVATGLFTLPDGTRVSMIKLITAPKSVTGISESTGAALATRVYPNPASETLNIDLGQEQGISRVALFDLSGTKLTEYQINNTGTPSSIDVSAIASGYYVLKVVSSSHKTGYVKIALTR